MKDQNCLVHLGDQTGGGSAGEFRHADRKFIRQVSLRKTASRIFIAAIVIIKQQDKIRQ